MLKHGETIVDMLGGEIDRIEMKLRVSMILDMKIFCLINFWDHCSHVITPPPVTDFHNFCCCFN